MDSFRPPDVTDATYTLTNRLENKQLHLSSFANLMSYPAITSSPVSFLIEPAILFSPIKPYFRMTFT